MQSKFLKLATVVFAITMCPIVNAGIIFGDDSGNTTFTLTEDIAFEATGSSDSITRFVFEDVYETAPDVEFSGTVSNSIGVEVEGVDVAGLSATNLWGPLKSVQNQMDTKDFIISFENSLNFVAGNTVTLKAGTAVLSMTGYIPTKAASGVVMVNSQGEALSDRVEVETIRVPEPATFALLFLGMFGIAVRRLK
jgi:hypothetical protein